MSYKQVYVLVMHHGCHQVAAELHFSLFQLLELGFPTWQIIGNDCFLQSELANDTCLLCLEVSTVFAL